MRNIPEHILKKLDDWGMSFVKTKGREPTLDEVNEFLAELVLQENKSPSETLDGYSPSQLFTTKNFPLDEDSIIQVGKLQAEDFEQIPLFRQIKKLGSILLEKESIKLTATGALPPVIVKEVYTVGIPHWSIEDFPKKVLKQMDCISVERTFIMLKILKITKVQKNILTLTKKGKQLLENPQDLLILLLNSFLYEFNWGYFDGYDDDMAKYQLGSFAAVFSLLMVARYGDTWKSPDFYAEKYFKAYPFFLDKDEYPMFYCDYTDSSSCNSCYIFRTFERFMLEFGLVKLYDEKDDPKESKFPISAKHVKKAPLFDKMIKVRE